MVSLERLRCEKMANDIAEQVSLNPALFEAFCSVARSEFAPLGAHAFSLNAQPILASQWISSPLTVARMTMALSVDPKVEKILEIGCGSGYQAAILSRMVHRVFAVERVERFTVRPRYERNVIHAFHPPFDFYRVDTRVFHIRKLIDHIEIFTRKDCGKIITFKNRKIFTCSFFFRKPQYTR